MTDHDVYCDCDDPLPTICAPVYCCRCHRYIDPERLERQPDGGYRMRKDDSELARISKEIRRLVDELAEERDDD